MAGRCKTAVVGQRGTTWQKGSSVSWTEREVLDNFKRARRQSFLARLVALIERKPNDLLPLDEVRSRLHIRGQHYLGVKTVPVSQIVGSEGRYTDFDRQFLPRHSNLKDRWVSVNRAYYEDVILPPVELYKMGEIYFVRDGNHRVSVAHQLGQEYIDAYVTELDVAVPLTSTTSLRDLLIKEEYNDFLEWTNLDRLRPSQRIEFTELGGYLTLVAHINTHRYYLGLEEERAIDRDEAVIDWYDQVYLPVIQAIHAQDILRAFPGRTEADLYRWIMDHRWFLLERSGGIDPGPEAATSDYAHHFGRKSLIEFVQRLLAMLFSPA